MTAEHLGFESIGEFRILKVRREGTRIVAVLPLARVLDYELRQALNEECLHLAQFTCETVELDLRNLEYFHGGVVGQLLKLRERFFSTNRLA